ncbi:B-cell receptor CD22-like [Paramuricea clavata]|uniref:B-cell receptor CD22-like n=1 Tax=Paramuricea clavata TaxID=317549 RepID=A0A6S7FM10_PARCT|nr:B-cell receptor CD22-like [Paramuricea clavata]
MTNCVFGTAILFALSLLPFPCEGKITSPPDGTRLTFLPGSTDKIQWTFDDDISSLRYRNYRFTSSNGSQPEQLARIYSNGKTRIFNSSLPGIAIEKPATLVLKNIDLRNNGTYRFELRHSFSRIALGRRTRFTSNEVVVFVAVKPTVTMSCSSPVTVNEGDNFTCVCRSEGGNPPANVTWYDKDGVQIGGTGKEGQTLTLSNVDGRDSGTYKCVAQSHINATEEKPIEVRLNLKPSKTAITFTPEKVVVGKSVTITCESNGFPEPSYTIVHNDTEISNMKTLNVSGVEWSDAGSYQCVAINKLGRHSKSYCLTVVGETAASKPSKVDSDSSAGTVALWHVVVSLVSGIIIGILLSYIVFVLYFRRRWCRNRNSERNPDDPTTEADTTYQALDLKKMNTNLENDYQSLQVNDASNYENVT